MLQQCRPHCIRQREGWHIFSFHMSPLVAENSCWWWRHIPHKYKFNIFIYSCPHRIGKWRQRRVQRRRRCPQWATCNWNAMSAIKQNISNSAMLENKLKPGVIKVETRFRYHFGRLRQKVLTPSFFNRIRNRLETDRFRLLWTRLLFTMDTRYTCVYHQRAEQIILQKCRESLTSGVKEQLSWYHDDGFYIDAHFDEIFIRTG